MSKPPNGTGTGAKMPINGREFVRDHHARCSAIRSRLTDVPMGLPTYPTPIRDSACNSTYSSTESVASPPFVFTSMGCGSVSFARAMDMD